MYIPSRFLIVICSHILHRCFRTTSYAVHLGSFFISEDFLILRQNPAFSHESKILLEIQYLRRFLVTFKDILNV